LVLQAAAAMVGGWSVGGPDQVPDAWAVLDAESRGTFNVLWIGQDDDQPFPAPGGDPTGIVPGDDDTIRYSLTARSGVSALDIGRTLTGPGDDHLRSTLSTIVEGSTAHGGALLAPFGVRFLVAETNDLPPGVVDRLDAQLDLDRLPAAGLVIYRSAAALPPAGVLTSSGADRVATADPPSGTASMGAIAAAPLGAVTGGWAGQDMPSGVAFIATEYSDQWRLADSEAVPQRSFGWATVLAGASGAVQVTFAGQQTATITAWLLALVWAIALWVTRKPVGR
jgi:hypothetical protein